MIKGMGSVLAFLLKLPGFVAGAMGSLTRVTAWLIGGLPHAVSIGLDAAREFFINIGHGIESVWNNVWGNVKNTTSQGASVLSSFWTTITGPFIAGYNFVLRIFNDIKNFITSSFDKWWANNGDAVVQVWHTIWTNVRDVVTAILLPIITVVKVGMSLLVTVFKFAWDGIKATTKLGWDFVSGAFRIGMSIIGAVFRVGWAAITLIFKSAIGVLVASWNIFWSIISNVAKLAWTTVKNVIKGIWDVIVGLFGIFINLITGHWSAALTDMKNLASQIWNLIKSQLSAVWNAIKAIGIAVWNSLRGYLVGLWNNMRGAVISSWNAIRSGVVGIWRGIVSTGKSIWNDFFGWLRAGWRGVVNSATAIWNGIKAAVSTPVKWIVNNVWDRFAGIINTATNFLRLGKPLPVVKMAGGGKLPGYGGGDQIPALLEAGETVVDKNRSKKYAHIFKMMGVPGYSAGGFLGDTPNVHLHRDKPGNAGLGDLWSSSSGLMQLTRKGWRSYQVSLMAAGGTVPMPGGHGGGVPSGPHGQTAGPTVSGALHTALNWTKNLVQGAILGVVKPLVNGALGLLSHMPGGGTPFGKMISQFPKEIANHFFDWIGGQDSKFMKSLVGTGSGGMGDSGKHSGSAAIAQAYARSIMGRYGWGPDQWPPWLYLGNQESGWNAYAVNASSGAYGIGQSLGHGHPYNLGDYVNQIIWMANYIRGRYGNPASAWAHERAYNWYANGTNNASPGWAMVGERGPEAVWFNGGEKVSPISAGKIRGSDGASAPIIVNLSISPTPLARPADIGREVVGAIKQFEKGSGKSWRS